MSTLTPIAYLQDFDAAIEGRVCEGALLLTDHLLAIQDRLGAQGHGGVEIGAGHGKYLAYLVSRCPMMWCGLDVFLDASKDDCAADIRRVAAQYAASPRFALIKTNTQSLGAAGFADLLGQNGVSALSFAAVSHEPAARGIGHDLALIEPMLAPGGLLAVDRMVSGRWPDVSESFFAYMHQGSDLRPVAISDHLLFMTTRGFDDLYRTHLIEALTDSDDIPADRFTARQTLDIVRPFLGASLVCL